MKRYILTGTPGAGKTAILWELAAKGYAVVAEAATDVIAREQVQGIGQPWNDDGFIDKIVNTQRQRQQQPVASGVATQIYDRSPICTVALAEYLGRPVTDHLAREVDRVVRRRIYERQVFFVRSLGFVAATAARQITFEDALAFERVHERVYRSYGYELVEVPREQVAVRAARIDRLVREMVTYRSIDLRRPKWHPKP